MAELYGDRWSIETAFQELARDLNSEIDTLGYPQAARFGFCVAMALYNAVALMRSALRGAHGAQKVEQEVSDYYIAAVMLMLAGKANLRQFRKHPRGPKKPQPKRSYDPAHPHVSTARLLAQRPPRKRRKNT